MNNRRTDGGGTEGMRRGLGAEKAVTGGEETLKMKVFFLIYKIFTNFALLFIVS